MITVATAKSRIRYCPVRKISGYFTKAANPWGFIGCIILGWEWEFISKCSNSSCTRLQTVCPINAGIDAGLHQDISSQVFMVSSVKIVERTSYHCTMANLGNGFMEMVKIRKRLWLASARFVYATFSCFCSCFHTHFVHSALVATLAPGFGVST